MRTFVENPELELGVAVEDGDRRALTKTRTQQDGTSDCFFLSQVPSYGAIFMLSYLPVRARAFPSRCGWAGIWCSRLLLAFPLALLRTGFAIAQRPGVAFDSTHILPGHSLLYFYHPCLSPAIHWCYVLLRFCQLACHSRNRGPLLRSAGSVA